ncbi:MAG: hypothetical protein K9L85_00655 [Candidatus Peribacteraceae bacterium]|nr:hypothetical protein [Candidatus Peribacteraceae bacterium]
MRKIEIPGVGQLIIDIPEARLSGYSDEDDKVFRYIIRQNPNLSPKEIADNFLSVPHWREKITFIFDSGEEISGKDIQLKQLKKSTKDAIRAALRRAADEDCGWMDL